MGIGLSVLFIAVGAILAFAVNTPVHGLDLVAIGWILLVLGIVGIALELILWPRRRIYRSAYVAPTAYQPVQPVVAAPTVAPAPVMAQPVMAQPVMAQAPVMAQQPVVAQAPVMAQPVVAPGPVVAPAPVAGYPPVVEPGGPGVVYEEGPLL
jgi:hypothetical protein